MRARWIVAHLALAAIALGFQGLERLTDGVAIERTVVAGIPTTVFKGPAAGPVVVIGHGFAGSQQLMLPFAVTLARNGYTAVTFDFPGHGRNPAPLSGGLMDEAARSRVLDAALGKVITEARRRVPGPYALLGHSMASDIVLRRARTDPDALATVALSMFSPDVTATSPRNLLVIAGALEPGVIRDEGRRIAAMTAPDPQPRTTYGAFDDGTARRFSLSGGVEHIAVLFSQQSLEEARLWLDRAFGRRGGGWQDDRPRWLGLLFAGIVALGWPLSRLLPAGPAPVAARWSWLALLAPPVLTPLLLWRVPTAFLPSLLGDYLTAHFAVYGGLTWLLGRVRAGPGAPAGVTLPAIAACFATTLVFVAAFGLPIDHYLTSFELTPARLGVGAVVLLGVLPYALAEARLTGARGGRLALARLCLLLSFVAAIALNPPRLFFLVIILPVMALFLGLYGLFAVWVTQRTGRPWIGALATSVAFAWSIAATFPIVR